MIRAQRRRVRGRAKSKGMRWMNAGLSEGSELNDARVIG